MASETHTGITPSEKELRARGHGFIQEITRQRDFALEQCAEFAGENAALRVKIAELEAALTASS